MSGWRSTKDGFNGAITFSLWKSVRPRRRTSRIQSFNGAITFSLWKCYSLSLNVGAIFVLQWGHNFFVMEMYYSKYTDSVGAIASMGP